MLKKVETHSSDEDLVFSVIISIFSQINSLIRLCEFYSEKDHKDLVKVFYDELLRFKLTEKMVAGLDAVLSKELLSYRKDWEQFFESIKVSDHNYRQHLQGRKQLKQKSTNLVARSLKEYSKFRQIEQDLGLEPISE